MALLSGELLEDGQILDRKFSDAEELISIGELDHQDFSSPLARKVIFLQGELVRERRTKRFEQRKVDDFMLLTRRFLSGLKDGKLTEQDCKVLDKRIKAAFPGLAVPKRLRK